MKVIYDAIVVGAGIYGSAISYFLSKRKIKTLLIEKFTAGGGGASRYSGGLVRLFDKDSLLTKFNFYGREEFINWEKNKFSGKSPYYKTGLLYLINEDLLEPVLNTIDTWGDRNSVVMEKEAYVKEFPYLKNHPAKYILYEKESGYADVRSTIQKLIQGFKSASGTIVENCEILSFKSGKVWELNASAGTFYSNSVIFATGSYSSILFPEMQIKTKSIPLTLIQEHSTQFSKPVIDDINNTYIRPLDNHLFYCGSQHIQETNSPNNLKEYSEYERLDSVNRINNLSGKDFSTKVLSGFNGFDGYTKDNRPIMGFDEKKEGLYHLTGFSGRGFKCSLALSKIASNEIIKYLNKSSTYDSCLSL